MYNACAREIANKGAESRFVKADRGQFALQGAAGNAEPQTETASQPAPKKPAKKAVAKKTPEKKGTRKPADGTPGPKSVSNLLKI